MIPKIKSFVTTHITGNAALVGITIAGLLLRLWHLTSISLWHDEAFSALLIKYSWSEMMMRIGLDVHPPLYYVFLRVWSYVFGHSLFSLRGMSVLFGVATIVATYYFVNYIFKNRTTALIAAALIAVNPFQVQYVTEARMYTMGAFFAIAAAFALSAALRTQTLHYATVANEVLRAELRSRYLKYYALFVLCSAILIHTHYYLLFMVAALGAYAVLYCIIHFRSEFDKYIWVILSGLLILLSFMPWLKVFLFQFKQVGAGYWIPPMDKWSIPSTLWELLLRLPNPAHWMFVLVAIFTIYAIIRVIWKYTETEKWLVIAGFLAPFAGALFFAGVPFICKILLVPIGLIHLNLLGAPSESGLYQIISEMSNNDSSVYLVRYFIFCSSFYLIIVALFLSKIKIRQIGMLLMAILLVANIFSIWNYWDKIQVQTKPGMSKASEFLTANVEPDHKLFVGSSFEFFNFKYYNRTPVKPLLFTNNNYVRNLPHFAGTAILTDDDLVLNFSDVTKQGDTIWLLWTNGFGGSKPSVPTNWCKLMRKASLM